VLAGVNGFYETGVFGKFPMTWAWGTELAAAIGARGLVDLTFNQYGNRLTGPSALLSGWRRGLMDLDAEVGYTHRLFEGSSDVRMKASGYKLNTVTGSPYVGYKSGLEVGFGRSAVRLAYEHGFDRTRGHMDFLGAQVRLTFGLGDLLQGKNPISLRQTPASRSDHIQGLLTKTVRRQYPLDLLPESPRNSFGF
jgi:hypothetical protein